jgi:hypothetical protein
MKKKNQYSKEYKENEEYVDYYSKIGFGMDKKIKFKLVDDKFNKDPFVTGETVFVKFEDMDKDKNPSKADKN